MDQIVGVFATMALDDQLQIGQCAFQEDGSLDGEGDEEAVVAEVLAEEDEHGLVENADVVVSALVRTLAFVVEDGSGHIEVFEPGLEDAVGEVDVFAVHEEVFVEQAALPEGAAACEEAGAADDFDFVDVVRVEILHIVTPEGAALGEESAEAGHLAESGEGHGQSASRLGRETAVGVEHPHAEGSGVGTCMKEMDAVGEGVLGDDGVGIEQEDVLATGLADGLVVGSGKAHVLLVLDVAYTGMKGLKVGDGPVGGVVVNDKYFVFDVSCCFFN